MKARRLPAPTLADGARGVDAIDRIRAFNRCYTGRLGLLPKTDFRSGLGLAEVRILDDLDTPNPPRARDLAQTLGLDEGHVSRVLAGFERRGWLVRAAAAGDGRRRDLRLTDTGRAAAAWLKSAAREALAAALSPLPPGGVAALATTLGCAEAILSRDTPADLRALAPGDAGWIVERHGALYAADEGFDTTFEALVAEIVAAFLHQHDPARERGRIAARGPMRLGLIFCVTESAATPDIARLRLFLVEPSERGTGLAQRMLETCLGVARGAGYRRMRRWTHESHRAAGRLYARNGFHLGATRPARSFGQEVVEQTWERAL